MDGFSIEHIAGLAALELTDEEKEGFGADIASILDYMQKLQEVDVPLQDFARAARDGQAFREDAVEMDEAARKAVLEAFPAKTGDDLLEAHGVLSHK